MIDFQSPSLGTTLGDTFCQYVPYKDVIYGCGTYVHRNCPKIQFIHTLIVFECKMLVTNVIFL